MNKVIEGYSYTVGILGTVVSVTDLENILNICLLVCSVLSILLTTGFKVYDKIKQGRHKEAIEDAQEGIEQVKDALEDALGKEKEDDDKTSA